jgi:hypothetical protein
MHITGSEEVEEDCAVVGLCHRGEVVLDAREEVFLGVLMKVGMFQYKLDTRISIDRFLWVRKVPSSRTFVADFRS